MHREIIEIKSMRVSSRRYMMQLAQPRRVRSQPKNTPLGPMTPSLVEIFELKDPHLNHFLSLLNLALSYPVLFVSVIT